MSKKHFENNIYMYIVGKCVAGTKMIYNMINTTPMNLCKKFETYCSKIEEYIDILKMTCQPCKYGSPAKMATL